MNSIISKVTRLSEREELLNFLDQLEEIAFNLGVDVKSYVSEKAPFHIKKELTEYITNEVEKDDRQALSQKIKALKDAIKALPTVRFTIPFEPREEFVLALSKLLGEELKTPSVIEFICDENLLGGAVIEGRERIGKYVLSRYFEERGEELLRKNGIGNNNSDI